jgi:hypothetical protein
MNCHTKMYVHNVTTFYDLYVDLVLSEYYQSI